MGKPLENEYLNGFSVDLMTNSINYDDLLISALITLAPKEVTIHTKEQDEFKETLKTIENIFGERLRYCPGCKICLKYLKLKAPFNYNLALYIYIIDRNC